MTTLYRNVSDCFDHSQLNIFLTFKLKKPSLYKRMMIINNIFYFNQLIEVNFLLILIEYLSSYKEYSLFFFITVLTISIIYFASKSEEIFKTIGHVGSAVVMGVVALDSTLNLYDRFKNNESNSSSSNDNTNDDNNQDKDKNKKDINNDKDDNNKDKDDNKKDNAKKSE